MKTKASRHEGLSIGSSLSEWALATGAQTDPNCIEFQQFQTVSSGFEQFLSVNHFDLLQKLGISLDFGWHQLAPCVEVYGQ